VVVYIHGETPAVPVYFRNSKWPYWKANDRFGWLKLAGHGTEYGPGQEDDYCIELANATPMVAPNIGSGAVSYCNAEEEPGPCMDGMTYAAGCAPDPIYGEGFYHGDGTTCADVGLPADCQIPILSPLGLGVMAVLVLTGGAAVFRRGRSQT
jgi:hypothetical protein